MLFPLLLLRSVVEEPLILLQVAREGIALVACLFVCLILEVHSIVLDADSHNNH
jgi:hypothetical protein